jgi:hypothetical protein
MRQWVQNYWRHYVKLMLDQKKLIQ